jgi:hypothetical protein
MADIDSALRRLSKETAPPGLSLIEDRVMARVEGHSFAKDSMRLRAGAVAFALVMGVVGGMLPDNAAKARPAPSGLSEAVDLAPSTLLAGAP